MHNAYSMTSVLITYFVHGTTTDNEQGRATGWRSGELSELGKRQSMRLRDLTADRRFDVVFCSDLKRAVNTAKLAFEGRFPIVRDKRLRECNYGEMTGESSERVEMVQFDRISVPFPRGESYKDVERRMREFLDELLRNYEGKYVAIVSHKAPQLALDVIIAGKSWGQAMHDDWRRTGAWKPGWDYKFVGR